MMKSLLAFALTILGVLILLSHARQGMTNIDSTSLPPFRILTEPLNEAALLEVGLQMAHSVGLVGEPTEIRTLLVPISKWHGMMLSSTAFENPSMQVFVISVKGDIPMVMGPGGGASADGLTIEFTTPDMETVRISSGFIDDLAAETTEEDRQTFKALQEMDIMSIIRERGSLYTATRTPRSPEVTPEVTLEPISPTP